MANSASRSDKLAAFVHGPRPISLAMKKANALVGAYRTNGGVAKAEALEKEATAAKAKTQAPSLSSK